LGKNKGTVLVVDDDPAMRDGCRRALEKEGVAVLEAGSMRSAFELIGNGPCDVVLLDLKMPDMGGMEGLKRLRSTFRRIPVVVITGYPSVKTAVEAMKWGAVDYLTKPFRAADLRLVVRRALADSGADDDSLQGGSDSRQQADGTRLIGETVQMKSVRSLISKVADTDSTVLIIGESGTGKEVVARLLHEKSGRSVRPFVVVDCGSIVGTLVENELFGHVKGSYTGAVSTTHGRFELADGGTLFLDEVGCLRTDVQAKLLRVLERGEFSRVGGRETVRVDVRIIAATNADLAEAVKEGSFREDLFYRLSVVPIVLPPLRQRKADIPLLAEHFLRLHARRRHKKVTRISPAAMEVLMAHDWPGNVRELSNAIERAVVLAEGNEVVPELLLHYGFTYGALAAGAGQEPVRSLREVEEAHIRRVLRQTGGNRRLAAEILGIDRKTLWRRLRKQSTGG